MWKHSKLLNCNWLFMQIIALEIGLNEAAQCTDCPTTKLGTESKSITYGPSIEYNCNCDWTIPTSMPTDHETAVVLLLQNVSLPTIKTAIGYTLCSGSIRFPSADGYKCDFKTNYCLAFTTESTICNINRIREKIPVANHICDSIIPWNKAGGSPYKIEYIAINIAYQTKHFTIQYHLVDCRLLTTPMLSTASEQESTTKGSAHTKYTSSLVKQNSDSTPESSCQTSLIIATPVSGIMGLIAGALLMFIILRYCNNNKEPKNKDSMEMGSSQNQQPTVHERTTYENYTPTADESGYEVPNQVDNKNEQSGYEVPIPVDKKNKQSGYEVPNQVDNKNEQSGYEVPNQVDNKNEQSGYEVPIQVDNKNEQSGYEVPIQVDKKDEQQYEVVKSGSQYENT
uniref:uncharacterized protein LOC120347067 n=1 Tax=Styela clava TaxID=7725 RepID=UPI00193AD8CD|nr:uncharacterized protein LOC120347067 [Styela clava]